MTKLKSRAAIAVVLALVCKASPVAYFTLVKPVVPLSLRVLFFTEYDFVVMLLNYTVAYVTK